MKKKVEQLIGYVIGTQTNTLKVRVPKEIFLPRYQKCIVRHQNYLVHDETKKCLVGDVVRIARIPRISANKAFAVAQRIREADRYVDERTGFVYTNGHLTIPVGYRDEQGQIHNAIPRQMYKRMGLI